MLTILKEQKLCNILVVVTRYFGGILLGTGGLVRAYSDAEKIALENVDYVQKEEGYEIEVEIKYKELEKLKYYCEKNNIKILNIEYLENIRLIIEMTKENFEKFTNINSKNEFQIAKTNILKIKYVEI